MKTAQLRHPLRAWLDGQHKTQEWLALELGVSRSYVAMLQAGVRTPSLRVALRLEAITGIAAREFVRAA